MPENRYVIAAGPVVIENGRVLLVKHGADPFWKFPGGKLEDADADLESAARREAKEELGIEAKLIEPLAPLLHRFDGGTAVLIHYLAERDGDVIPGPDIAEWGWFFVDALPTDVAPNVSAVIADWRRRGGV